MESEFARRRINTIAAHFTCVNDLSAGASRLLPLNCSSSLSSAVKRHDNRVYFARQGSSSQSCFMRQASMDLSNPSQPNGNVETDNALGAPMYCRPAKVVNFNSIKSVEHDYKPTEPPKYARPSRISDRNKQCGSNKQIPTSKAQKGEEDWSFNLLKLGEEIVVNKEEIYIPVKALYACHFPLLISVNIANWSEVQCSPRTNIAESECNYIIFVELPGIGVGGIKVEVNAKSLIVTGRRSTTTFHTRQILQGPCQLVWPLPANVNKDGISAEFVEGILQINIPKL